METYGCAHNWENGLHFRRQHSKQILAIPYAADKLLALDGMSKNGGVAELVDASDLKSEGPWLVGVRFPSPLPFTWVTSGAP
jgi:hypothetical protein